MPQGSLNTAVDRLIEDVSTKILGKRKQMLKPDDNVTLDGGMDISCNTFDMLRQWLLDSRRRLLFGHGGSNQAVSDRLDGQVYI